jgi:hypothetical protein
MMRQLLCTYTTGAELMICRAYFLTDLHRRRTWDGVRRYPDSTGRVRQVTLAWLPVACEERYYYFTVEVELANGDDNQEIILDIDGNVIEPEIRRFQDEDEYYRYLNSIQEPLT